jgi:hypothetical protein
MIVFRILRGRWSPLLAKEFRRTRRAKSVMLLARIPSTVQDDYYGPFLLRVEHERRPQKRPRKRPSSSRPAPRGPVLKRDGLMRCVTEKRGQYERQELDSPGYASLKPHHHGKPLASAAAHHQLRHGAATVFPF